MAEDVKKPKKTKKSGKGADYYRQEAYSWRKMYTRLEGEWRQFLKMIKDTAVALGEEKLKREQAEKLAEAKQRVIERMARDTQELEAQLSQLENALNWETSCLSCAKVLDSSIQETERAEKAESALAEFERKVMRGEIGGQVVTNHAFEGAEDGSCTASFEGAVCGFPLVGHVLDYDPEASSVRMQPFTHRYTSTACQHELHEECRKTCKFCVPPSACRCDCHSDSEKTE